MSTPWAKQEIDTLRHAFIEKGLMNEALATWCRGHGCFRTAVDIRAKLRELDYFVQRPADRSLLEIRRESAILSHAARRRNAAPAERQQAIQQLAREIAAARAEAATAPLFRPTRDEIDTFLEG